MTNSRESSGADVCAGQGGLCQVSAKTLDDLERLRFELYLIAENEKDFTSDRLIAASRVFESAAMLFMKPETTRQRR